MYFNDLYNTQWHKVLSAKGRQSAHTKFTDPQNVIVHTILYIYVAVDYLTCL